jgi:predicted phosphodiesterase
MRVAILSDIHGNSIALDAVLEDIEQSDSVDEYWVLGDLAALGHAPVQVLERLAALPEVRYARGNTDRYVCTGDRPPQPLHDVKADPTLWPAVVEIAGTFAWTQGAITSAGWLEWLSQLPLEFRIALPDGTKVLGVHAAPGRDDGAGFRPGMNDADLVSLLGDCDADLVFVGHTHQFVDVVVGGTRVVNPGSVSNPLPPDLRAFYVLLEADSSGYAIESRQVDYDREAVIRALERIRHPGTEFIARHMRGPE